MTPRRLGSSPQSRGARLRSAMAKQQAQGLILRHNFLLTCSDEALASHELALLAKCADIRAQLEELLCRWNDTTAQASVVRWFRSTDRQALKHAIENEESPIEWAKRKIREEQRSEEELIPLPALESGATHLAAAQRYAERNIAEGKCSLCPKPLARHSVRYCEKHLTAHRLRATPTKGKPGSIGWLYGETEESSHGRQPGTLAALAMGREQKTRAALAELGIPPESAAVSLKAATQALLKCMPASEAQAATVDALFKAAVIPSRTTGHHAIEDLLAAGAIQRVGTGVRGNPFRYFKRFQASEDRAARLGKER
jgi:hypothetical protein